MRSMSRAVSAVETCDSSLPASFSQPAPKSAASLKKAVSSAVSSGVASTDSPAWISLSLRQRTPSLSATPRGSQLTRSYRSCSSLVSPAYEGSMDTPEPPGPPKLNRSEPRRSSSPVALLRISASPIVPSSGFV